MGTPHKHAELIKAWADGAEIQIEASEERWVDNYPLWNPSFKYRIKPKTIKYRAALFKGSNPYAKP